MEDKVLSQRWCLLFLPPPASFSTSGSRVVTIEWLNGTSMDRTEARDPAIPTGPAHSRRSPDPRASRAESEMPRSAEDNRADPYRLGLRQPGPRAKAQAALWERGRAAAVSPRRGRTWTAPAEGRVTSPRRDRLLLSETCGTLVVDPRGLPGGQERLPTPCQASLVSSSEGAVWVVQNWYFPKTSGDACVPR